MRVQPDVLPPFMRREGAVVAAVWSAVGLVAILQALILAGLSDRGDLTVALVNRVSIVPLWALATPLILRSARRWPIVTWSPAALLPVNLARHVALGSLFIVVANFAIQLPFVASGTGIIGPALHAIAANYPPALIVYLVIVALGHVRREAEQGAARDCLTIRQWNRVHFVRFADVDWIEAQDNYIVVHAAGRSYRGRDRISDIAAQLDPRRFVRIHRSTIVQVARIREVQPLTHGDHAVILRDGTQLRASRSRREALSEALAVRL